MDDVVKTVKDAYDQGYKQGHTDGIKQIRDSIVEFTEQASKILIETIEETITNKKGDK